LATKTWEAKGRLPVGGFMMTVGVFFEEGGHETGDLRDLIGWRQGRS
jgi:hypothetical protein